MYNKGVNIKKMKALPFVIFNDGAERFGLQTYYIKPAEQIKQLQPYFKDIRVFLFKNGNEIVDKTDVKNINDDWLYFLCK